MEISIYINSQIVDFENLDSLPFDMEVSIGSFTDIGVMDGMRLKNAANSIFLPASKQNKLFFENKNNGEVFEMLVIRDGEQQFKGKCKILSRVYKNTNLIGYSLDVYGGSSDLLERLEGVSLRDLDLGSFDYNQNYIESTFLGNCDNFPVIFSPCVYGSLKNKIKDEWSNEDLRPHTYYETILGGIETYLGVNILSDFRNRSIWKRSVYLYGIGDKWRETGNRIVLEKELTTQSVMMFVSSPTKRNFTAEIYIPPNQPNLDFIEVSIGGTFILENVNYNNGINHKITKTFDLQGNLIVFGKNIGANGTNVTNLPVGSTLKAYSTGKVIFGSNVEVSSCLHDVLVKDFLKEIFSQFNLRGAYNPILNRLVLEPAFPYEENGTIYQGFYNVPSPTNLNDIREIDLDVSTISMKYSNPISSLQFSYKENKVFDHLIDSVNNTNNIDVFGTSTAINVDGKTESNKPFFERIYNGKVIGVTDHFLPLLLSKDSEKLKDSGNIINEPDFENNPCCALVSTHLLFLQFEGQLKSMQLLYQTKHQYAIDDLSLSFCDTSFFDIETSSVQKGKGLVSRFYEYQLSLLKNYVELEVDCRIRNPMETDFYRNSYRLSVPAISHFFLLKSIDKYTFLSYELAKCVFVQYQNLTQSNTEHNALLPSEALLTIS